MDIVKIFINEVEVGSIPEEQYLQIVKDVRFELRSDVRTPIKSLLSVLKTFLKFALTTSKVAFFGLAILAAGLVLMQPNIVAEVIREIIGWEPGFLANAMQRFLFIWIGLCLCLTGIGAAMLQHNFGYKDTYTEDFNYRKALRIREILEVPATGDLDVKFVSVGTENG